MKRLRFFDNRRSRAFLIFALILLVVLSWLPQLLTLNPGISYGDEGVIAQAAKRVVNGQWPFRDFFTQAPPGAAWWYATFLGLFGETFLALRLGVLVTALLILLTMLWASTRLTPQQMAPALLLLSFLAFFGGPYWFIASLHWVSLLFCLLSFVLLLPAYGEDVPAPGKASLAGVAGAAAALTLQHKGGLWLLAATLALMAAPRIQVRALITRFWLGVLFVGLPVIGLLVYTAGVDQLVYQQVTFPLTRYHLEPGHRGTTILADLWVNWQNVRSAGPQAGSGIGAWLSYVTWNLGFFGRVLIHLFPIAGGMALLWLWWRRRQPRLPLALITALFVAVYLATLHRFHETTLVFAAPATVLVLAVLVSEILAGRYRRAGMTFVLLWTGLFLSIAIGFTVLELLPGKMTTRTPAGVVNSLYPAEAGELAGVTGFFRQYRRPEDQVVCLTYLPIFYYLMDIQNPTRYDILTYPINTSAQFDEVQGVLETNHVRWILHDQYSLAGLRLGQYLLQNYRVRSRVGTLTILERVSSPSPPG